MDRDRESVMQERGTGEEIVDLTVTVDGTGELMESREKNEKESIEEMENANITTNVPGQGKRKGISYWGAGDTRTVCGCAIVFHRDWETNRRCRKECRRKS